MPDTLKLKEAELTTEQRRLATFVDFIGEGRGSQAQAKALTETERRVNMLGEEVDGLRPRSVLGPIRLELVTPVIGRPFCRALTSIDALALTEAPPAGAEGGSNSLQKWRRRELNPRPRSRKRWRLRAYPAL